MIYLVEDDENIRALIEYTLNNQGLATKSFALPSAFWQAMAEELPRLVLLDIMLPEEDGISILKKLRSGTDTKDLPIMMLTAKNSEYDTVLGLDSGADDYIAKPFRMMELLSRIRALLRRTEPAAPSLYTYHDLAVSPQKHTVTVQGQEVVLTKKEFELLSLLLSQPQTVFSRQQLLNQVWGYTFDGESRTVDVHIRTLRQKLGPAGAYIQTIRGVGYKIGGEQDD